MKLLLALMIVLSLCGIAPRYDGTAPNQLRAALLNPKHVEPLTADELRTLLTQQHGQVVLVNLWATWCAPCLKEIPELVKLQTQYRERGLKVLGISLDEPGDLDAVRAFAQKRFPHFTSYLRNEPNQDRFISVIDPAWPEIMPTNFLLDRTGKLHATLVGGKQYEEFEAAVLPLLRPQ